MRNPLSSTGWVVRADDAGRPRFAGTCFAFRRASHFLTAAHCVHRFPLGSLSISLRANRVDHGFAIEEVVEHSSADVALLRIADGPAAFDLFLGETSVYDWGIPVSAFGYPEDTGETGLEPTPRYFRGNIQRLFKHRSHLGYRYDAAELSFGAPAGLSGGPVSPESDRSMVMGVVAENFESTTYLSKITEHTTDGGTYSEHIHTMINYAVAVRLDPLKDWLDSHIPYPGTAA